MKYLNILALIVMQVSAYGQIERIDKGNGDFQNLSAATTAIQWIEKGEVGKLNQLFSKDLRIDAEYLKEKCDYVFKNFGFEEGTYPMSFNDNVGKDLWYDRTYFKQSENNEIEYLFQISIKLARIENGIKIIDIQFREKDKIEVRDKEIAKMKKGLDDDGFPVAPPPPPPIED